MNIPIEMLHDDTAGRDNARYIYICLRELTSASCQSMAHIHVALLDWCANPLPIKGLVQANVNGPILDREISRDFIIDS